MPVITSIQLDKPMAEITARATDATGMSRVEFIRRLLNWYDTQPDLIQRQVLDVLPPSLHDPDLLLTLIQQLQTPPLKTQTTPLATLPGHQPAPERKLKSAAHRQTKNASIKPPKRKPKP